MSVSILGALQNAEFNLAIKPTEFGLLIGKEQLHNAMILLEKGYGLYDEVEPLLEEYGDVEQVPAKEEI